ncbi:MAG: MotA/TolQ/ExbB proton channel family protein [Desulfobacterales bacterium]|nr:MotA/TolQ/ExbB proton channel family protein [Desulfobacterales bacterium]
MASSTHRTGIRNFKTFARYNRNILGLCGFLLLFCGGFFIHGNIGLFFNFAGFLIVIGGTFAAALISFGFNRLAIVYKVLRTSFKTREKTPNEIVEILVDLSLKSKVQGLLSLQEDEEESTVLFLRRALGYLVDAYPPQQIKDLLITEIHFFRTRREESERVLRTLADISPAFGLIGSVVGLMGMLAGIGDTTTILATIPIALTSTLYGVLFANFIFSPFAAQIRERTDREVLLQRIIMDGVIAIGSDLHPRVLEHKLKSFLTPSSRERKLVSIEKIREKFHVKTETFRSPIKSAREQLIVRKAENDEMVQLNTGTEG